MYIKSYRCIINLESIVIYISLCAGIKVLDILSSPRNDSCVVGGENVLLDLWAVAEQLRREHPKHFDTLTRVRVTFQRTQFYTSVFAYNTFYVHAYNNYYDSIYCYTVQETSSVIQTD